ncbi:MAG: TetR/AcrR family transcriptional regulator [Nocardia sp.]|nr:TetR/AcrR family transcriptional regulator [Nocardia sp.]
MQPARTPSSPRQRATLGNSRSRDTRQALVRAALQLWSAGDFDEAYEASTAADIARAAGVSKGTFYFHFASKEDLLAEMASATAQTVIDEIEDGIGKELPLRSLTDRVAAALARRVTRAPRAAALRAGTLGFSSRAGAVTLAGPRLGVAFEALVRYGKQRGELGASIDEQEGAAMLTAVSAEAIIRWGAGNRSAAWLRRTLRNRAQVVLDGMTHTE